MDNSTDALLEYINQVKPYHTKVIQLNNTYAFSETINVRVVENVDTQIRFDTNFNADEISTPENTANDDNPAENFGYDAGIYGSPSEYGWPVIAANIEDSAIFYQGSELAISGNLTSLFTPGSLLDITLTNPESTTTLEVQSSTYIQPSSPADNPHTVLRFTSPLPSIANDQAVFVTYSTFSVASLVVGYGSAINTASPETSTNALNAIIISGDVSDIFLPTSEILDNRQRRFSVVSSTYNPTNDSTTIRILQDIDSDITDIRLASMSLGYDVIALGDVGTRLPDLEGNTNTLMAESIALSWSDGTNTVDNGYQFLISEIIGDAVNVLGNPLQMVNVGDSVDILGNLSAGNYVVRDVDVSTIYLTTSPAPTTGGYIEKGF